MPLKIPASLKFVVTLYLVKFQCLRTTIENKTSLATHFNKLTTENNVFIVSVIV